MTEALGLSIPLPLIMAGPVVVAVMAGLGWAIARVLFAIIASSLKARSSTTEIAIEVLQAPIAVTGGLIGVWLGLRGLPLSVEAVHDVNRGWIIVATLLLVSVALRSLNALTKGIAEWSPNLGPSTGMIRVIGRIAILSLGGVMLLQSFGIAVEPLIASLGIGSLAVALALRDTLSNFFAGLYLHADHPLRVGHYVNIENGEEGVVLQIRWRSTRLRNLSNNAVVVPNEKLAQSIMTNFDLPDPTVTLSIPFQTSGDVDPSRVLAILREEAKGAVQGLPDLLADPAPAASFGGFGEN